MSIEWILWKINFYFQFYNWLELGFGGFYSRYEVCAKSPSCLRVILSGSCLRVIRSGTQDPILPLNSEFLELFVLFKEFLYSGQETIISKSDKSFSKRPLFSIISLTIFVSRPASSAWLMRVSERKLAVLSIAFLSLPSSSFYFYYESYKAICSLWSALAGMGYIFLR